MVLLFWKFLIKKIIYQGKKNFFFSFPNWGKKVKEIFLKSPLEYINTTKIYTYLTPKKKKKTPTNFLYNIFFRNNFSLPFRNFPNKQTTSTHYTLLCYRQFLCGTRDASHPRSKTPWQCNRDARLQIWCGA